MQYDLQLSLQVLERTPHVLRQLVQGLHPSWTEQNEGGDSWNVPQVVAHLIHCDEANWLLRASHILSEGEKTPLPLFDRFAHLERFKEYLPEDLLNEFRLTREKSLSEISRLLEGFTSFDARGLHPQFGSVTLSQLLSAWVVHDLDHIAQISRIMAKQYKDAVGPWVQFLRILN